MWFTVKRLYNAYNNACLMIQWSSVYIFIILGWEDELN